MFSSIYKYILYKIQRLVAGQYLDDLSAQVSKLHADRQELQDSANKLVQATQTYEVACQQYQRQLEDKHATIVQQGQKLYDAEARLKELQDNPTVVWTMDPTVFKKFCAEFEPPVINGQSSDHEAAFKLGIQRVLSRIGERYVAR